MFEKKSTLKMFLIILAIIVVVGISVYKNYNESRQSNGRINDNNQLRIETSKIAIRESSNEESKVLGYVYKGEIYTILEEENGWYKIKTNTDIVGWIYGGSNYIYLFQTIDTVIEKEEKEQSYSFEILEDYLKDNYEYLNNTYQLELEDGTKYIFDLNKNEYKVINNTTIVYNYSTKLMTYTEKKDTYSIVVKWHTNNNEINYESQTLGQEYANNVVETIMKKEYERFTDILRDLNIEEQEIVKK